MCKVGLKRKIENFNAYTSIFIILPDALGSIGHGVKTDGVTVKV